jgi:hypothetical protein
LEQLQEILSLPAMAETSQSIEGWEVDLDCQYITTFYAGNLGWLFENIGEVGG